MNIACAALAKYKEATMAKIIPVQPFDKVVFGALGDLAKRKLFPWQRASRFPSEAQARAARKSAMLRRSQE